MSVNVFKRFSLEPADPQKVNLIGCDPGDGEFCAVYAYTEGGKIKTRRLFVDNISKEKDFTALFLPEDQPPLLGNEVLLHKRTMDARNPLYVHFKRPPVGLGALERYGQHMDDGVLTYKEIMQKNFHVLVQMLFKYNTVLFDKKRTVIFIGRPSSKGWAESDREYAKLLKQDLTVPGYNGRIDVVVYSEAQAALAYEYNNEHISGNESVAIIDGGSSTFDAVIVKDGKIVTGKNGVAEYSRQIGSGVIEENMLDFFLANGDIKILHGNISERMNMRRSSATTEFSEGVCKLELRQLKEEFYGTRGNNGHIGVYDCAVNGKSVRHIIDDKLMDFVTAEMPVLVHDSDGRETEFASFKAAVLSFFDGVRRLCKKYNVEPERVILTGGATVMPFVREIAESLFKKVERADFPSFSVAEGLAFMGYAELIKKQELTACIKAKNEIVNSVKYDMERAVRNMLTDAVWSAKFGKSLTEWAEQDGEHSLFEWFENSPWEYPCDKLGEEITRLFSEGYGYDSPQDKLAKELKNRFRVLLPGAKNISYTFKPDRANIAAAFEKGQKAQLTLTIRLIRGLFAGLFLDWNQLRNKPQRIHDAEVMRGRKDKICESFEKENWLKVCDVADDLYKRLNTQLDKELEAYIDGLTQYLVQYA